MQGHLATCENEIKHLTLRIKTLRDAIRGKLYPYNPVADIESGQILDAAIDLDAKMIELKEKNALAATLKKSLGR
jgi:hypothetical protein